MAGRHSGNLLVEADVQAKRGYDELHGNPFRLSVAAIDLAAAVADQTTPPAEPPKRITTEHDTQMVVLDGERILVAERTVFNLFAALAAAHNDGRTPIDRHDLFAAAGRQRDEDPRPDRLFKKLPEQLNCLINSEAVADGGYSLRLPPLKK